MTLFEPERHEPLAGGDWDESAAHAAIERIAADAEAAFDPESLWPIHPADRSPERPPDCLKPIYHGAAGVVWALLRLEAAGAVTLRPDYRATALGLDRRQREDLHRHPDVAAYMGRERDAFLIGETGTMLLQWTIAPSEMLAARLEAAIAARTGDVRGVVWGGAGAMLAALFLFERTGESRWSALYQRHVDALWDQWAFDEAIGCHLWTQDLYGVVEPRLSALHGFGANAHALLRGQALLPVARRAETIDRVRGALAATAVREVETANWPLSAGVAGPWRVQHCIGAPGMVNALAGLPAEPETDALLAAAGELTWRAGPVAKLPGLCHGAPGNGYAFLKLHRRTGDPIWLERARGFAMHAIGQSERARATDGRRKYSLWTGDLGLAVFLWDCIGVRADFPTLDVF